MKTWKRNTIIAAALALVCSGVYLNWKFGTLEKTPLLETLNQEKIMDEATLVIATEDALLEAAAGEQTPQYEDYFAQMRLSRQESRDSALQLLQETMAYAGEGEDISASSAQLNRIVSFALSEAQIESLVIAKGYSDCVAYMTEDGISLAVPTGAEGLTDEDVALLADIVTTQSDYTLPQIRIIEVH